MKEFREVLKLLGGNVPRTHLVANLASEACERLKNEHHAFEAVQSTCVASCDPWNLSQDSCCYFNIRTHFAWSDIWRTSEVWRIPLYRGIIWQNFHGIYNTWWVHHTHPYKISPKLQLEVPLMKFRSYSWFTIQNYLEYFCLCKLVWCCMRNKELVYASSLMVVAGYHSDSANELWSKRYLI